MKHIYKNEYLNSSVEFDGKTLIANTGKFQRIWKWTGFGFLTTTVSYSDNLEWSQEPQNLQFADWILPCCYEKFPPAELLDFTANTSDDEGFTSPHLEIIALIHYPSEHVSVKFIVWLYPNSTGMRVQLKIKADQDYNFDDKMSWTSVSQKACENNLLNNSYQPLDFIPTPQKCLQRRMIGYHSDTQNRNDVHLPLLQECVESHVLNHTTTCEWANIFGLEDEHFGMAFVKESHKTINNNGHVTGAFCYTPGLGLECSGWGIRPKELNSTWQSAWATWCIAYPTDPTTRQMAFKDFDRLRYPISTLDKVVQANTWGSSIGMLQHRLAANETNVLKEIGHCAEMGIDVLQIDDGWQGDDYHHWTPLPERYPEGWKNVKHLAKEKGVKLGLWLAAMPITEEDLNRNSEEGGFISFKLDFAVLNTREKLDSLMSKVRGFIKKQHHQCRVNWDLTEIEPRYGYFYGREYGCIYLENRKPVFPRSAVYRPGTVLSDLWHVAHYCNLFKFQGSIQNISMCDTKYSDAQCYRQDYALAITLMSSPLFFCETQFFNNDERITISKMLKIYKQERDAMYKGIVNPIGQKPDGTQWTGFECVIQETRVTYLLIFREPWNDSKNCSMSFPQFQNKNLKIQHLLGSGDAKLINDNQGELELSLIESGNYMFLKCSEEY